jgi:regulator of cell morphogenesis and NO signaling
MNIAKNNIVGEVVAEDYRTASIFKKYNVDFCCNGNKRIDEVCEKKNISPSQLLEELNAVSRPTADQSVDYQSWPLDLLADYIEKKHHRYVTAKIQEITPYLDKVTRVHGNRHPELVEIKSLFAGCAQAMEMHMEKEEFILFPFIRKLVSSAQTGLPVQAPFGTVENPIAMMKHEHSEEGERFATIARLSDNYTPPADACNTYRVTFSLLQEFEEDLHLHIHLENNILFPGAIQMEKP